MYISWENNFYFWESHDVCDIFQLYIYIIYK